MSIILCLSSQVARGYIGGTAARIALERMGHECWLLPTVILSNHPGHARFAGEQVPPGRLRAMAEALDANGWLGDIDAVMTGYMPSAEHVTLAAATVEQVRQANSGLTYLCDPILGDDPGGLYVDEDVAKAVRDQLVPLAGIATPNRFELEWLSGKSTKRAKTACGPARELGPATVLVTSLTGDDPKTMVNLVTGDAGAWQASVPKRKSAPHGVGDLCAALFLGAVLNGLSPKQALGHATAGVEAALDASKGADELQLAANPGWAAAESWPVEAAARA
ncbi:pyridoxamine kinase [bacterium BMS3Bbin10]|nr:pyridoxamine kinase [bacterium BMS3Bbin10]